MYGSLVSPRGRRSMATGLLAAAALQVPASGAQPHQGPNVVFFAGQMTDNHWEETFVPWEIDLLESWFLGVGVGYEWPTRRPALGVGIEAQVVRHFGRQDNLEFNLPVILRYHPRNPVLPGLDSVAFGIGLSTASKDPQTEIDRDGETSKTLVYWMGELEFRHPNDDTAFILRLHHRSDAYGLFSTDSGSNALVFGLKRRF